MKRIISLLAAFLCVITVHAHKFEVSENTEKIGGGSNNALVVIIPETNFEEVLKAWKSEMKDTGAKVKKEGNEIFADNAIIKKLGEHPMDIYGKTVKVENGTKLIVGVNLGGAFLNSKDHKDQYDKFVSFLIGFSKKQVSESIAEQVKEAEKELKSREKEQEKLKDEESSLKDKITGWKDDIKEAEGKIGENQSEQSNQEKSIAEQMKIVEAIKAKEALYK